MRKAFTVALAAALAGAFAMTEAGGPALGAEADRAVRATDSYRGTFKRGGSQHEARRSRSGLRNGEAKKVRRMRYKVLWHCEVSGEIYGAAGWSFEPGIRVSAEPQVLGQRQEQRDAAEHA